jgi:succinyl-CoA synthetase alpha subunit
VTARVRVRRSAYVDSIRLMHVADQARRLPGVVDANLCLATEANRAALRDAGFEIRDAETAASEDLIIAVRAKSDDLAEQALAYAEQLLAHRRDDGPAQAAVIPRSITRASRYSDTANLAVISVPGLYAMNEALQAIAARLHVFVFSDGVAVEGEIALKRRARDRGVLVMGPECGTSLVGGVGLGFANRVRRGPVGLVGASGTGLQEVTTLLHHLGSGVSHAIGTGGRDLHDGIDGITTLQALELLGRDAATRAVVIVSKPASIRVAETVCGAAAALGKPVIACLLGWRGATPGGVHRAGTLEEAAVAAVQAAEDREARLETPQPARAPLGGQVAALYTGGTLSEETRTILGHTARRCVDFGAAEFTRGRPHPMIDPGLRSAAIAEVGDDAAVAVILLDFVLGHCAHPDPVGAATPAIRDARARAARAGRDLAVVAHVVGTDDDPQGLTAQRAALRALDVAVYPSNRLAALAARGLAGAGER